MDTEETLPEQNTGASALLRLWQELGEGLGLYLVRIEAPGRAPENTYCFRREEIWPWVCRTPAIMLTMLRWCESANITIGDWPQRIEEWWQECATDKQVTKVAFGDYNDLVDAIEELLEHSDLAALKLQLVCAEVCSRDDFFEDFIRTEPLELTPVRLLCTKGVPALDVEETRELLEASRRAV